MAAVMADRKAAGEFHAQSQEIIEYEYRLSEA
jgi:hypothetical protein